MRFSKTASDLERQGDSDFEGSQHRDPLRGRSGHFPQRIPIDKFIETAKRGDKEQLRKWVEGKIVLLGTDMRGLDTFGTPFYTLLSGDKALTAGGRGSRQHGSHAARRKISNGRTQLGS
jgi:hypothetical protein